MNDTRQKAFIMKITVTSKLQGSYLLILLLQITPHHLSFFENADPVEAWLHEGKRNAFRPDNQRWFLVLFDSV